MATKYPPQVTLPEAIRVIKEMFTTHKSKDVSLDLMPEILKVSQSSSYFPAKIVALQKFGFIERKANDLIELTDLAMKIVNPIGNEDIEAKEIAFRKDDVLSALLEKYPNGKLPSPDQLKQTLMKQFQVPRHTLDRWYQFVTESFKELNFRETTQQETGRGVEEVKVSKLSTQNIELPSGKKFSFAIEDGHTLDDLDFIIDFIELKKKRINK